jgi:hypothetical protein
MKNLDAELWGLFRNQSWRWIILDWGLSWRVTTLVAIIAKRQEDKERPPARNMTNLE